MDDTTQEKFKEKFGQGIENHQLQMVVFSKFTLTNDSTSYHYIAAYDHVSLMIAIIVI